MSLKIPVNGQHLIRQPIALILFPNPPTTAQISELVDKIKKVASSSEYTKFLGKHYIRVNQSADLDKISEILNIILQDYPLQVCDGSQTYFTNGSLYTLIDHQHRFLQDIIDYFDFPLPKNNINQADKNWDQITSCGVWRQIFFKNQFWKIKEAQDFFQKYCYRKLELLPEEEMPTRFGSQYYDTDSISYPEKMTLEEIEIYQQSQVINLDDENDSNENRPLKKRRIETSSPQPCLICQDTKPSTIVFNCGHSVLCESCSLKMQKSGNKYRTKCLQCTLNIESIYYSDSNKLDVISK